ncbi:MAG TPA: efflux RND transporter periplasmic adaptor subunit, partial [Acidobacteriota bacterium]|nr:efflux RND transporter periplasmic adaptor subunit [Acidobacteriota bacterium]
MTLVKAETPNPEVSGTTGERKILYWQDPMNPANRSDKPGKAPDGMDLVPVYAEEGSQPQMPPGTVKISAAKQQLIGVTYGEVTSDSLTHTIRTVGRVAYDETKITRIHTKIDGWLDKVFVDFTGKLVTKGQPLISLYSPDLVSTQQEYLLALKAKNYLGQSEYKEIATSTNSLFESSRKRLLLWDIPEEEIQQIEKRGEPMRTLTLYAPSDGFVLAKNAYERQRVTPETELYTIADLSNIWVLADIYEYEIPSVKLGQSTTVTFSAFPGETFRGKITYIYPQLDNMTRTLKVRIELPNSGFKIKPDMYANIELQIGYGEQLSIPEEAVLDSGSEQTVFVVLEGGYFEPRNVQLGAKVGNRFIILNGLNVGEKIVT